MTDYVSYSENDFREAFDEFYKLLTDGKRPVNSPKAFLLGGQSGAGKTTIPDNISVLYKSGEFNNILLFNRKTECLYNMKKQPQQNPAEIVKRELNGKQIQHQNKPKHHR